MHVKGFLVLILILLVSLYSCQDKKETVRDFDSIQPKSKKTQKIHEKTVDTLAEWLAPFNSDSVRLKIDSLSIDSNPHFLDRFTQTKGTRFRHYTMMGKDQNLWFGRWEFPDTTSKKNALFNWLDHFGPEKLKIEWFGKERISKENELILINKLSIISVHSLSEINREKWRAYQRYIAPKDSTLIIIYQPKGAKCKWTKLH